MSQSTANMNTYIKKTAELFASPCRFTANLQDGVYYLKPTKEYCKSGCLKAKALVGNITVGLRPSDFYCPVDVPSERINQYWVTLLLCTVMFFMNIIMIMCVGRSGPVAEGSSFRAPIQRTYNYKKFALLFLPAFTFAAIPATIPIGNTQARGNAWFVIMLTVLSIIAVIFTRTRVTTWMRRYESKIDSLFSCMEPDDPMRIALERARREFATSAEGFDVEEGIDYSYAMRTLFRDSLVLLKNLAYIFLLSLFSSWKFSQMTYFEMIPGKYLVGLTFVILTFIYYYPSSDHMQGPEIETYFSDNPLVNWLKGYIERNKQEDGRKFIEKYSASCVEDSLQGKPGSTPTITDFSTVKVPPKIKFKTRKIVEPPKVLKSNYGAWIQDVLTPSVPKAIITYFLTLVAAPKYRDAPKSCIAIHVVGLTNLLSSIYAARGKSILTVIKDLLAFDIEAAAEGIGDEEDDSGNKMEVLASAFDKISQMETSTFGTTVTAFFTFITTLPIVFSKAFTVESYKEVWTLVCSGFKVGGASFSTILKGIVGIQNNISSVEDLPGSTEILRNLFSGDSLDLEFNRCANLFEKIKLGLVVCPTKDHDDVRKRFLLLAKRCSSAIATNRPTAQAVQRAKNSDQLLNSITILFRSYGPRMTAYADSYYSTASGIGKSTFLRNTLSVFKHRLVGLEEVRSVKDYQLGKNFQDITNDTTEIQMDDQGQIVESLRKESYANAIFNMIEPTYIPVEKPELRDKGNHFYCHSFCTYIDNNPIRGIDKEVTCLAAGLRRLGDSCEVRLKSEYENDAGGIKEGVVLDAWGSHLEFRPYEVSIDASGVPTLRSIFPEEWLSNEQFFKYKEERIVAHFERQRKLLDKMNDATTEPICNQCKRLPSHICSCGDNFMDAKSKNSESSDEDDDAESSVSELSGSDCSTETFLTKFPVIGSSDPDISSNFDRVLFHYSMLLVITTYTSGLCGRFCNWIIYGSSKKAFRVVDCIIAFLIIPLVRPEICVFLAILSEVRSRIHGRIRHHAYSMSTQSLRDIISTYGGNLKCICGRVSMFVQGLEKKQNAVKCVLILAALVAVKVLWNRFVSAIFLKDEEEGTQDKKKTEPECIVVSSESTGEGHEIFKLLRRLGRKWAGKVVRVKGVTCEGLSLVVPEKAETEEEVPDCQAVFSKQIDCGQKTLSNIWESPIKIDPTANRPAYTTTMDTIRRFLKENTRRVAFHRRGGTPIAMWIVMINSRICISVAHGLADPSDGRFRGGSISYSRSRQDGNPVPSEHTVDVKENMVMFHPHRDLMAICFSSPIFGTLKNLKEYLAITLPKGSHTFNKLSDDGNYFVPQIYKDEIVRYHSTDWSVKFMNDFTYLCTNSADKSAKGMCGLPMVTTCKPHTIVAIHAAGDQRKEMVSIPITFEDFENFEKIFEQKSNYLPELTRGERTKLISQQKPIKYGEVSPKHPINFILKDGTDRIIEYECGIESDYKPISNIVVNPHIFEAMSTMNLKPIVGKPKHRWKESARAVISMSSRVMKSKYSSHLTEATDLLCSRIKRKLSNGEIDLSDVKRQPLSVDEALNGVKTIPAMKLNTASGVGGKKSSLVTGEYPNRKLEDCVNVDLGVLLSLIKSGEDPNITINGSIKDELKKDNKDSRFFFITPFPLHLLHVMYFRPIIEVMTLNPKAFFTAIGLNRVGEDWYDQISQFYTKNMVKNCFDTDVKDFDKSRSQEIGCACFKVFIGVAEGMGYSDEDIKITKSLLSCMLKPPINVGGTVCYLDMLWVSGNILTAHANGVKQVLLHIADLLRFCESIGVKLDWEENIPLITLGDDGQSARSDEFMSLGWTVDHLSETFLDFGYKITPADKTEELGTKNAEECEFLKSKVHYHEDLGMNISVVGPKSYLKPYIGYMPPSEGDIGAYYSDVAHNVMMEAFFGGRSSFDCMRKRLKEYHAVTPHAEPPILDKEYHEWVEEFKVSKPQVPLCGVRELGMSMIEQYDNIHPSQYVDSIKTLLDMNKKITAEGAEVQEGHVEEGITQLDVPTQDSDNQSSNELSMRIPIAPNTVIDRVFQRRYLGFEAELLLGAGLFAPVVLKPYDILVSQRNVAEKLGFVAFMRANIKIEVEITVPGTMSGAIIMAASHFPDNINDSPFLETGIHNLCALSQKQHVIMNIGAGSGMFEMIVPYFHPAPMLPPFSKAFDSMTKIYMVPIVEMCSSMEGNPRGTMKIYFSYDQFRCTGATGVARASEAEGEEISTGVKTVGEAMSAASNIPGLGSLSTPSEIVKKAGDMLHYAGFSKQEERSGTVLATQNNMPNGNGAMQVHNLSLLRDQEITPSGVVAGMPSDEMEFSKFIHEYSLIDRLDITTATLGSTTLRTYNVTPAIFVKQTNTLIQPTSVSAPTLFFSHWNGGMQYKFMAICPLNTSGKIRVQYDPHSYSRQSADSVVDPSEDVREHVILDLAVQTAAEVTVGYSSNQPALYCPPLIEGSSPAGKTTLGAPTGTLGTGYNIATADPLRLGDHWNNKNMGSSLSHNGSIEVSVHTRFQTGSGNDMPVTILVYARAAKDMTFFKYQGVMIPDTELETFPEMAGTLSTPSFRVPPICVNPTQVGPTCEGFQAPPKEPTAMVTVSPSKMPTPAPVTLSPTPVPTGAPVSLAPTPIPTPVPTTLKPTPIATPAPTGNPTPAPTLYSSIKGAPGRLGGRESEFLEMYWLDNEGANLGEASWKVTGPGQLHTTDRVDAGVPTDIYESGISLRLVSGDAQINGVSVPTVTDTLLYQHATERVNFDFTGTGFDVRAYSGSNRLRYDQNFKCKPPSGWNVSLFSSNPDVYVRSSNTLVSIGMEDAEVALEFDRVATITFRGNIDVVYGNGETATYNAASKWRRVFIRNDPSTRVKCNDGNTFVYSITYVWLGEYTVEPHNPNLRRRSLWDINWLMAEGETAIAQTDNVSQFWLGASRVSENYIPRALAGESCVSWRIPLKVPVIISDYVATTPVAGSHFETTVISNIYIDGSVDVNKKSLYGFLISCYNGMRGGMLSTYQALGDGSVSVSCVSSLILGTLTAQGPGSCVIDPRTNAVATVKFPCQRNVDFTYTLHEGGPESLKRLTISGWGDGVRVKEWRSISEDFSLLSFRGCPKLRLTVV